ncbi:MAG: hypothetical protein EPO02_04055 [Nitrospirae bacterium]|nr:MAG: hypothetical protein EPO02_04055 [Nitrospirota bacterium]
MQFDPAIAAQASFARARTAGELGPDLERAEAAEEIFSAGAGREARDAYFALVALGEQRPDAVAFQEFLIYITWQQVTEETIPAHFQRGLELCDRYLGRLAPGHDATQAGQIRELRRSYRAGLGLQDEEDALDYDADRLKGGD